MRTKIARAVLLALLAVGMGAQPAQAAERIFQREYTYRASEADSKLSCRAIALEQVKRILLEELGTYLVSLSEIKGTNLTRDEVTTISAGVVQTEIRQESWDGQTYYIKVEIVADPDAVARQIREMAEEREELNDLRRSVQESGAALAELERLRAELAAYQQREAKYQQNMARLEAAQTASAEEAAAQRAELERLARERAEAVRSAPAPEAIRAEYDRAVASVTVNDLYQRGVALRKAAKYGEAYDALSEVIRVAPGMAPAWANRGGALLKMRRFKEAVADFTRAIEIDPNLLHAYRGRGAALVKMHKRSEGMRDLEHAASLGDRQSKRLLVEFRGPFGR
jgi:tetratricopeptide (TPR) repeat protein